MRKPHPQPFPRHRLSLWAAGLLTLLPLGAAGAAPPPRPDAGALGTGVETGLVAYYNDRLAGKTTASGERYDPRALTMAHPSLPFGSRVRVINLSNRRNVVLRVNDRGPHGGKRMADVSRAAAEKLQMFEQGVIKAELEVVWRADTKAPAAEDHPPAAAAEKASP